MKNLDKLCLSFILALKKHVTLVETFLSNSKTRYYNFIVLLCNHFRTLKKATNVNKKVLI